MGDDLRNPTAYLLVRVEAQSFVAGLIVKGGAVVEAAPILRWTVGKQRAWLSNYFRRKGWKATIVRTQ